MAFHPLQQTTPHARAPAVRLACYNGLTEVRVTNDVTAKLGLPTDRGEKDVSILVAIGSDEHQGLIQISSSTTSAARMTRVKNGKFGIRLQKDDLNPIEPDVTLKMTPVSFLVKDAVLTIELPSSKYKVAETAKAYMRSS